MEAPTPPEGARGHHRLVFLHGHPIERRRDPLRIRGRDRRHHRRDGGHGIAPALWMGPSLRSSDPWMEIALGQLGTIFDAGLPLVSSRRHALEHRVRLQAQYGLGMRIRQAKHRYCRCGRPTTTARPPAGTRPTSPDRPPAAGSGAGRDESGRPTDSPDGSGGRPRPADRPSSRASSRRITINACCDIVGASPATPRSANLTLGPYQDAQVDRRSGRDRMQDLGSFAEQAWMLGTIYPSLNPSPSFLSRVYFLRRPAFVKGAHRFLAKVVPDCERNPFRGAGMAPRSRDEPLGEVFWSIWQGGSTPPESSWLAPVGLHPPYESTWRDRLQGGVGSHRAAARGYHESRPSDPRTTVNRRGGR